MRYSQLLIPTLKETPKDAEVVSHQLMVRAGMIRKVAAGIYSYLPLGLRVIRKFEAIVREEMNTAGAQEVLLPAIIPSELWQESGRWDHYGKELLRIKDRHDKEFCYGPTHEEVITDLVKQSVKSYRDLPINLYQIQTKFRDEIRPRFGLMRGREFGMKDSYSFHASWDSLDDTYRRMQEAYHSIFERCGLNFRMVQADSGAIGGNFSAEFMVLAATGEDAIIGCDMCGYAANVEAAETVPPVTPPVIKKSLFYTTVDGVIEVVLRADRDINEIKLKKLIGEAEFTGTHFTGRPIKVVHDHMIDIVNARAEDVCAQCGTGHYEMHRGIETGHIFKLGTQYSEAMSCTFTGEDGDQSPMIMGCYGIGIGRTVAAAIEQNHDASGICWPIALAPFQVSLILTNIADQELVMTANVLYKTLQDAGVEVLLDDRNESAGIKFKDHDLIGIPYQIVIGKKWLQEKTLEVKTRRTRHMECVSLDQVSTYLAPLLS
jgi:prolyl-tRNA synthetase